MRLLSHRASPTRGFGLLEAIVALTLLASTGAALFVWIGQSLREASRADVAQQRAADQLLAQAVMQAVNPQVEPAGERQVGVLRIRWQSTLRAPMRLSLPSTAREAPRWRVGLFDVDVETSATEEGRSARFALVLAGLELLGRPAGAASSPVTP